MKKPFKLIVRDYPNDKEYIINSLEEVASIVSSQQYILLDADGETITSGDMGFASVFGFGSQEAHNIAFGIK